jgi:hypothetical protein
MLENPVFIDFLDELGHFIGEKPIFTKTQTSTDQGHHFFSFQPIETFRNINILILRGTYCFFSHFDEFLWVATKQKFFF